jgi:hypothetical protein
LGSRKLICPVVAINKLSETFRKNLTNIFHWDTMGYNGILEYEV